MPRSTFEPPPTPWFDRPGSVLADPTAPPDPAPPLDAALPIVRRDGLQWTGGTGGRPFTLRITFENPHAVSTAPQSARIRVAEFGAFLPWSPFTRVNVGAIPPGGRRVVTASGDPSGNLAQLLQRWIALAQGDGGVTARSPMGAHFMAQLRAQMAARVGVRQQNLRAEHLLGNFDLRVGLGEPLERHFGRLDGLVAGVRNLAQFKLGDGRPDTYRVRVASCEPGWQFDLRGIVLGCAGQFGGCTGHTGNLLDEPEFRAAFALLRVTVQPPAHAESGSLALEVHRASIDARTTVEFELGVRRPGRKTFAR